MDGLDKHKKGIGERIKALRGGCSQVVFAEQLKISLPALQRYEYGERIPRGPVLDRIAIISGKSVEWILTGIEAGADRVAERPAEYHDDLTQKVVEMMKMMSEEDKREVLKYASFRKQDAKKKLKEGA